MSTARKTATGKKKSTKTTANINNLSYGDASPAIEYDTRFDRLKEIINSLIDQKYKAIGSIEFAANAVDTDTDHTQKIQSQLTFEIAALKNVLLECDFIEGKASKMYTYTGTFDLDLPIGKEQL